MAISELRYDRAGAGEPVVLIHGIGHRRGSWDPIFARLAEKYDVIAVDLAGFGESAPYPKDVPYTMDNACADLAANFKSWGIDRPHVVGNSLGGAISLELAARGLVSSATVLSPAGFFGRLTRFRALIPLLTMWILAHAPSFVLRAVSNLAVGRRMIGFMLYAHPDRASAESTYQDALQMGRSKGFVPTVLAGVHYEFDSPVSVTTTVAWGTRDRLLHYRQSRVARAKLSNAVFVPLEGCGHVPMIDAPETVLQVIDETIARASQQEIPAEAQTA